MSKGNVDEDPTRSTEPSTGFVTPELKRLDSIGVVLENFHQMRMNNDFDEVTMKDLATPKADAQEAVGLENAFANFNTGNLDNNVETSEIPLPSPTRRHSTFVYNNMNSAIADPIDMPLIRRKNFSQFELDSERAVQFNFDEPEKPAIAVPPGFQRNRFSSRSHGSANTLIAGQNVSHFKANSLDFSAENSLDFGDNYSDGDHMSPERSSLATSPQQFKSGGAMRSNLAQNYGQEGFFPQSPHYTNSMYGMGMNFPPMQSPVMNPAPVPFFPKQNQSQHIGRQSFQPQYQQFNNPAGQYVHQQQQGGLGSYMSPNTQPKHGGAHVSGDASKVLHDYRTTGVRPSTESLLNHVLEFSKDSHGSRFIQYKMENSEESVKAKFIEEIIPQAVMLASHPFGNYVVQNFLLHAAAKQRYQLAAQFMGHLDKLSTHAHGCRVVQYAFDIVSLPQRNILMREIVGSIDVISKNNHGTHVVQKLMKFILDETIDASVRVKSAANQQCEEVGAPTSEDILMQVEQTVEGDLLKFCIHPHSYRLVQQTLANCDENRSQSLRNILGEISRKQWVLAIDQHGNFILQHILDHGSVEQADQVHKFVASRVLELSQHKFGSHLVEKCFLKGTRAQCSAMIKQCLNPTHENKKHFDRGGKSQKKIFSEVPGLELTPILMLSKDPYANFVVQKAFDASAGEDRNMLAQEIRRNTDVLSRFTYGRHILSHLNHAEK